LALLVLALAGLVGLLVAGGVIRLRVEPGATFRATAMLESLT
jgi:hypothetical protein